MRLIFEVLDVLSDLLEENDYDHVDLPVLAEVLAAACSGDYAINLIRISITSDDKIRELMLRLATITREPDYSIASLHYAMRWLGERRLLLGQRHRHHFL